MSFPVYFPTVGRKKKRKEGEEFLSELYRPIGQLKVGEEVYLKHYQTVSEVGDGLAEYFLFYNTERIHEALDYRTPYEPYVKDRMQTTTTQAQTMH